MAALALVWLAFDCFMAQAWNFASALGVPGPVEKIVVDGVEMKIDHAGRNWHAVAHPFTTLLCWAFAALWLVLARADWRALVVPVVMIPIVMGLGVGSVLVIDPDTWKMPDKPAVLWQWLTILIAVSFLYAWWFTSRHWRTVRTILLTGFVLGMLGAFEEHLCGSQPPFLQGSVCGGATLEQYVRYVLTALVVSTIAVYGLHVWRR